MARTRFRVYMRKCTHAWVTFNTLEFSNEARNWPSLPDEDSMDPVSLEEMGDFLPYKTTQR